MLNEVRFACRRLIKAPALDLPRFLFVTLTLAGVALAASFLPAQRATRPDPMIALSHNA